ncbi:MAG: hypothetical protein Q4A70_00945 [Candidatus Saccharibacteria bacterium]|nr:hypothetical protein [Candidatus Saccharibacteria bacterium]
MTVFVKPVGTMTAKQLRLHLKSGMTTDEVCSKYGCTTMDLHERIFQLYGKDEKGRDDIFKSFKANEKKSKPKSAKQETDGTVEQTTPEQTRPETVEPEQSAPEQTQPEQDSKSESSELETLTELEKTLSHEVMTLEAEHKGQVEKRRQSAKKLRELQKQILELQDKISGLAQDFDSESELSDSYAENMKSLSEEIRAKSEQLEGVRKRLEELTTVTLAVYDSGEIAVIDQDYTLDDTGHEEVYAKLLNDARCEELRMKDVRVLARVMQITSHLSKKFILLFDRAEVEEAYKLLSAK